MWPCSTEPEREFHFRLPFSEDVVSQKNPTASRLVSPHVALQQPRPRKRLAAHGAAARQRVRPDVHLQRAERRVRLAAVTTRQLPACSDDDTAAAAGYRADTGRRLRGTSRCRRRSSVVIVTLSGRRVPVSGRIPLPVSFFR